jgi:OOP family OmpA-OmpF porin
MRNKIMLPALLAAGLALTATAAAADDLKGLYAGIGVGSTSVDRTSRLNDSDISFKIFAGYSFNKFFAVELAYLDGGTAKRSEAFGFPGITSQPPSFKTEIENKLVNLSAVGNLPLTESFSLFGKLGYAYIDTDTQSTFFSDGFSFASFDDNQRKEFSYAAGATYSFGKSFQLRAEYEGFDVSRGDLSAISLSGIVRF